MKRISEDIKDIALTDKRSGFTPLPLFPTPYLNGHFYFLHYNNFPETVDVIERKSIEEQILYDK